MELACPFYHKLGRFYKHARFIMRFYYFIFMKTNFIYLYLSQEQALFHPNPACKNEL